ncbi:hypothetical protein PIB30_062988 [Stylosanthes scabra]|uniref:Uncharacterized protein n=1 Tax=Stylosanthes scabra TaxID=79078 RepID=A0ABU6QM34_9FABA|nr:hypothetical protein [Stylosanthes scabra]
METQRVTKPSGVTFSPENLTRSSEYASKSLSVRPSMSKHLRNSMSAELRWSTNTLRILVLIVEAETTSGWFMLLVVCRISYEEKTIAGGGLPARVLGMTSTDRHECLLRFAAFLDGGFPSSRIPPRSLLSRGARCALWPFLDEVEEVSTFFRVMPVLFVVLTVRASVSSTDVLYGSWSWYSFDLRYFIQKLG